MVRLSAVLLFVGCLTAQEWAQPPQGQASVGQTPAAETAPPANTGDPLEQFGDFSAVMVGTVLPRDEREGHIYRSGNVLRMEGLEKRGYYITNLTTFDTFGLSSMGCASMKQPYLRSFPFILPGHGHKVERVSAGKETVDGHVCQVEEVTYSSKSLPEPWRLKLWEAEDLHGFPIKVDAQPGTNGSHSIIRYKDVVLGPQDPTLFIYPKDCAELSGPSEKKPAASPKAKKAPAPPAGSPTH